MAKEKTAKMFLQDASRSKERYTSLFQYSNDGIILHDLKGTILDVNLRALNILGYEKSEMLGLNLADILPEYAGADYDAKTKQIMTKGYALFETDLKCKTGQIISAEISASLFQSGEDRFIQKTIRDITARKQAEQQLLLQDTALRSAANGIVITDKHGTILWVNTAFTKLTGYSFKEAIGKNPRILKSDSQHKEFYKDLWNTVLSGRVWHGELINSKKDGTLYFEEQTITPVRDERGEITHFIGIKTDITDRKLSEDKLRSSEHKFRAVAETATDAIVSADSLGNIIYFNKGAEKIFGYNTNEVLGKSLRLLMPKRFRDDHQKGISGVVELGQSKIVGKTVELVGRKKDSTEFPIELSLSSWMSEGDTFFTSIIRDISERKKAQSELKESREQYYNLFNHSLNGFALHEIITNKKGNAVDYIFLEVNKAFEAQTGLRAKDLIGKKATEVIPGIEADPFFEVYGKVALTGEPAHFEEFSKALNRHFEIAAFSPQKGQFATIFMDITGRKLAELEIREQEKELRLITESSLDTIFVLTNTGKFQYISPSAKELVGYEAKEIIGTTLVKYVPKKELARCWRILTDVFKNKIVQNFETYAKHRDGRIIPIEINGQLVKTKDRWVAQGTIRNITLRKESETALRDSEERYRMLFKSNPHPMWVYDLQTLAFLAVNDAAVQHYGYSRNEFLSMTIRDIRPREDIPALLKSVSQGIEGIEQTGEWRHQKKDGTVIDVEITSHELIWNGRRSKVVRTHDITDRKRIVEDIRWLAKFPAENPAPVLRISRDGVVLFANKSGAPVLQEWQCKINQLLPDVWREFVAEVFETGQPITAEISLHDRLLSLTFAPILEENYVNVYGVDITDLKNTEALLRKRTHDLGERVKEMTCLYGVHHLLDNSSLTLDQKLHRIVEIIPPGWQYPEITCARIKYKGKEYKTGNFHKSKWRQSAHIVVGGEKGTIEVFYLEDKPEMDIGPFLKEEKDLIDTIAKNIEEHIEYENALDGLRNSEERLKILFESAPDAIYLNDLKGHFVDANKAGEELTGYKKQELIGKSMLESHLLSASQIPKAAKLLARSALNKPTGPDVLTLTRKDGTAVVVEIRTFPIKIQNKKFVLGIARDITERRKAEEAFRSSEEKYRTIFEETKDVIYITSVDGEFIDMNPAGVELFGYDSLDELMSANIKEAIYDNPSDYEKFQKALAQQGSVRDHEMNLKKKNGEKLTVLVTASIIKNENNAIIGYRGIMRDITTQKELTRQLLQAQKMEAIGTLAGGIAHDFNNILGAILGFTELTTDILDKDNNSSTIKRNLDQVFKAGLRAKDLVQQILTFSRQAKYQPRPLRLELVVNDVVKLLRASIPASIEILRNVDKKCGYVNADLTQMHQVLMNLCTNAYHAMRERGTGTLKVALQAIQIDKGRPADNPSIPEGNYLKLSVSDTGHGISPENLQRIFDPFFTTKGSGFGTGLGLSVVHGIVKEHSGAITVISKLGEGSIFNIYLPRIENSLTYEGDADVEVPLGTENILLVDDEEVLVSAGKQILENIGYEVTGSANSLEALEMFQKDPNQFDLVITDLAMPKMTGIELAKRMLEIQPDIPIILVTGYSETLTRDNVQKMGLYDLIIKPVLTQDFGLIVRNALDSKIKDTENSTHGILNDT